MTVQKRTQTPGTRPNAKKSDAPQALDDERNERRSTVVFSERAKNRIVEHTQKLFDALGIDEQIVKTK